MIFFIGIGVKTGCLRDVTPSQRVIFDSWLFSIKDKAVIQSFPFIDLFVFHSHLC